ncbi:MAG: transporter related [Actinomycetia bacterium]|nr:transporter related [Actinomycetes bacterium]
MTAPTTTTTTAVETIGLQASIGGSRILQGIDLSVPSASLTALLGRNGVGKTTTLRSLIGLVPGTGTIRVLGRDVAGWATHKIIRLGVGYVPEDREVFGRLTVRENLRLAETGPDMDYDQVYALFPELKQRGRQLAGTLSGGQQQMLAIGRVLLAHRPLLLIDEPTKGLAPKFVSEVVDALERVREAATILMVEQNVHVVRRLAQNVIVLDHGQVVHAGPASDLADEDLVRRLLGVSAGEATQ